MVQAEDWSAGHEVMVSEIAPAAILSQDYDHLHTLLTSLAQPHVADKVTHTSSSLVLLLFIVSGYRVGVVVDYAETKMNSRVPKLSFERLLIDFKGTIWRQKR